MNTKKILHKEILICIIGIILISPVYSMTEIQSGFNKLTSDIHALPSGAAPGNSFIAKVDAAQAAVDRNDLCTAINILGALRNEIGAKTGKKGFTSINANQIDTDVISIIVLLLEKPETVKCGGGTVPAGGNSPETTIVSSDANGIQLHISFPRAHFTSRIGNGDPFTDISMDGMGYLKDVGKPDIPVLTQLFAIPIGADVSVKLLGSTSYTIDNINLWPRQEQPVDDLFGDKPFKIDTQFYAANAFYPTDSFKTGAPDLMRDLTVGSIETDGAQYNSFMKSLKVNTEIILQVTFGGGNTRIFGDNRVTSVWNKPFQEIYSNSLLNYNAVKTNIIFKIFQFCGKDNVIITSPQLRVAANLLADARSHDGFWTEVVEVGNGKDDKGVDRIGTTPEDIQKYIQDQIVGSVCINRPSYVTIVGDTANVPTFHVDNPAGYDGGFDGKIASDLPYGLPVGAIGGNTLLTDVFIGRIPIPTSPPNLAQSIVTKIIGYEDNPPAGFLNPFYSKATFTSYFQGAGPQDERGFTKTSETIRGALIGLGYDVDRVYTDDGGTVMEQKYYDGMAIPAALQKPGFGWNGNTQDVINDWNSGRFLIFHRDHGSPGGWANPDFTTGNIPSLTNGGLLPVVFSINCASGKFDDSTPNFAEQLIQKIGGGAVGVIGDSRNSPSYANNHVALGLFDAIFPSVIPTYGSSTPITRMGNVLYASKLYMNTQNGLDLQGNPETQAEHYLYHWFGDPTMQIWTDNPNTFTTIGLTYQLLAKSKRLNVQLAQLGTDDTELTVEQGSKVIGRELLSNGQASIELQQELNGEPLQLSLEKRSFVPEQVPIQVEATISGTKFNDFNGDGTRDPEEPGISDWQILLTKPDGTTESTITDQVGNYRFTNLASGDYVVSEDIQSQIGWVQTLPGDRSPSFEYDVPLSGNDVTGLDFGNHLNIR